MPNQRLGSNDRFAVEKAASLLPNPEAKKNGDSRPLAPL